MQGSRSLLSAHRLLTSHAAICNAFFDQRHMASRPPLRLLRALSDTIWVAARLPLQSQTRLAGTCQRNSVGHHICIQRALTRQLSPSLSLSLGNSRSSRAP
jgi:hypothetical protein